MKTLNILFLLFILSISGCDPDYNPAGTYHATIKGNINNTAESITLGDTLKFEVKWPDTIFSKTPLGDTRTDVVNSLQYAWYGYRIFRIDTINRKVYTTVGDSTKVIFFFNPGYENTPCLPCYSGSAWLQNNTKPYKCILNLVPQVKGVFYLEIKRQAGPFKINNNFEGLFTVSFDVPDNHLGLVDTYLPGFANAINQAGMSVYCFRVN